MKNRNSMPEHRKALIIADGMHPPPQKVRSLSRKADIVVCADGGANYAGKIGIRPDIILGDLDSITPQTVKKFKNIPLMYVDDQETTDLEKAILYCLNLKSSSVTIAGGLGSRIDHATGSLGCLKKYSSRCNIMLYDSLGVLVPVRTFLRMRTQPGEHISLIPLTRCSGVTTKNLKYPLTNEPLEIGVREGISNEATGRTVSVRVHRGTLLLYRFQE